MRIINEKQIIGVKIMEDENDGILIKHFVRQENGKHKIIQFDSIDDFNSFIKSMREWKSMYEKIKKDCHC